MATFSIGFTSSQVLVMLSAAMYIMLTAAAPLVHIRTDRSACNSTMGQEIHNNLTNSACENGGEILEGITNIVSYTLLPVNIAKLCIISAYYALLVHSGNNIRRTYKA